MNFISETRDFQFRTKKEAAAHKKMAEIITGKKHKVVLAKVDRDLVEYYCYVVVLSK